MGTRLTIEGETYEGNNWTWKKGGRGAVNGLLTMPDSRTLRLCVPDVEAMRELEGIQPDEVRLVSLFWPIMEMAEAVHSSKNAGEKSALVQSFLANLLACFGWPMTGAKMTMREGDTRADAAPLSLANAMTRQKLERVLAGKKDKTQRREVPHELVKAVLEMFRQIGASPTHETCGKMLLRLEERLSVDPKSLEALKGTQATLDKARDDKARLAAVRKENKAREDMDGKSWLPIPYMQGGHLARLVKRLALRYDTITPEPRGEIGTDAGRWFSPLNAARVAGQLKAVGGRVNHAAIVSAWPDTVTALPVAAVDLAAGAVAAGAVAAGAVAAGAALVATGWAADKLTEIHPRKSLRYKGVLYEFSGQKQWDIIGLLAHPEDPEGWVTLPSNLQTLGCFTEYKKDKKGGVIKDEKKDALRFRQAAFQPWRRGRGNIKGRYRIRP
jgi:hypothetical protein